MSMLGLKVFDATLQKTHQWLNDLMLLLDWGDKNEAYLALRATLHELRDSLPTQEVAQLAAQLPMLVRGFYYEGWNPAVKPEKQRSEEQFLAHIARHFQDAEDVNPERVARAVFTVMANHVSEGEIEDVRQVLPSSVRRLWPPPAHPSE